MLKTRGGNWYCAKGKSIIPPVKIIVCSPKKDNVHNYEEVAIKTKLELRRCSENNNDFNLKVHSTDNTLESIQYLNVINDKNINLLITSISIQS